MTDCVPERIQQLEDLRDGSQVRVELFIDFAVARADNGTSLGVHRIYVPGTFGGDQWRLALEQSGFGSSLRLEVPFPAQDQLPEVLYRGVEQLRVAQRLRSQGHHAQAIATCRTVLKELDVHGFTKATSPEAIALINRLQANLRSATVEDRLAIVHVALTAFANAGPHATEIDADLSVADSRFLLAASAAFLALAPTRGLQSTPT